MEIADPISTSTAGTQNVGLVAFDGTGWLVAYSDRTTVGRRFARVTEDATVTELALRFPSVDDLACGADGECAVLGVSDPDGDGVDFSFVVTRFAVDGTVHDATPVVISTYADSSSFPGARIAAVPGGFVVVDGSYTDPYRARTLTASGLGAPIAFGPSAGEYIDLACGPTTCAFAYLAPELRAYRFTTAGVAIDATPVTVAPAVPAGGHQAAMAWDGSAFRIFFRAEPGSSGHVLPVSGPVTATPVVLPRIRSPVSFDCRTTGDCYFEAEGGMGNWAADDSVGGSGFFPTSLGYGTTPVACGTGYCASTRVVDGTIVGSLVVVEAPVVDFEFAVGVGADVQRGPLAAAEGLVLFQREMETGWDVIARRLDAAGEPTGAEVRVTGDLFEPAAIDVTRTTTGWAVVVAGWTGNALHVLDATGTPAETAPVFGCQSSLSIAWNGTHHLVGCIDATGQAVVRRYDAIGQRVDTSPTVITTGAREIDVTTDGTGWLAVVTRASTLRAYRIAAAGTITDGAGTLVRDHPHDDARVVEVDGAHTVAWMDLRRDVATGDEFVELRTAVLDAGGTVTPLGGEVLTTFDFATDPLALAVSGGEAYVAWGTSNARGDVRVVSLARVVDGVGDAPVEVLSELRAATLADGLTLAGDPGIVAFGGNALEPELAPLRVRLRSFAAAPCTDCDAGPIDGGTGSDGGTDGGLIVAGDTPVPDAGVTSMPDTGMTMLDAGTAPPPASSGGCSASRTGSLLPALLLGLLVVIARRRR